LVSSSSLFPPLSLRVLKWRIGLKNKLSILILLDLLGTYLWDSICQLIRIGSGKEVKRQKEIGSPLLSDRGPTIDPNLFSFWVRLTFVNHTKEEHRKASLIKG
jgi:hypothetical protein